MTKRKISTSIALIAFLLSTAVTVQAQTDLQLVAAQSQEALTLEQKIQNTYVQGIAAKQAGELGAAVRAFRTILRVQPGNIRARRALVDCLMIAGEYEAAEFHLAYLLDKDPNPTATARYYAVQDEIVRKSPLSYSGTFAVLPSTNVNNGVRVSTFTVGGLPLVISDSGLETSGYGVLLGGNASYRWPLGNGQQVRVKGDVLANWYEIEALRSLTGTVALQYERDGEGSKIEIGPYVRRTWYLPVENPDKAPDNYAVGISMGYEEQLNAHDKISINLRYEYQNHFAVSSLGNYKSGPYRSGSVRINHEVNPSLSVFTSLGLQRYAPPLSGHLTYSGVNLSVGATKLWSPELMTGVTLGVGERAYDGYYPLHGFARQDQFYSLTLSARSTKLKVFDVIPQLSCTYKRNQSNVAFFDYETTNCQIALTQSF